MLPDPEVAVDDATIHDDDVLWRRVNYLFWERLADGWRISSEAFANSSDGSGMSVHLVDVAREEGLTHRDLLPDPKENWGVVALTAGQVRALRQIVVREPEPHDPSHAEVVGGKTSKVRKRLRDRASIAFEPPRLV